ncbi:hypothetical protein POPTR_005G001001v4 [Populus trichocarpa]|uniref:Uncharacterized protein n=1 Tax=Populus trichocarpa TaxID=3694 RepID=A0A3N7F2K3_POPTR|nr:hypothetical protein POPTR_005G001001v4 [Populus trichocarpa]RQO89800.1 hypothetical protein POPTR_005G001001v4 [Populus trichocarpa]
MRRAYRKMWRVVPDCTSKRILRTESMRDIEEILKSKLATIKEDESESDEVEKSAVTPAILARSKKRSEIRKKGRCFVAHLSFKNRMLFMTAGLQVCLHR